MSASYDAAGYLKQMSITRGGVVPQQYDYEWDEVGRLTRAARKDGGVLAAELTYAYDASDQRVRKSAGARHSIYVFGSLELRSTEFDGTGYTVDDTTEVPYLFGHGVRLARVTYTDAVDFQTERRRIFLELGDHLGSTAVVMDRATGELVERSTAYAYGAAESHYRPARWDQFREDYRFTGKEDDIEVGLIYFGARYLNPQLGRWISADPLAVHAPGKADLNLYAYVHGRVLSAVDPVGLDEDKNPAPDQQFQSFDQYVDWQDAQQNGGNGGGDPAIVFEPEYINGHAPPSAAPGSTGGGVSSLMRGSASMGWAMRPPATPGLGGQPGLEQLYQGSNTEVLTGSGGVGRLQLAAGVTGAGAVTAPYYMVGANAAVGLGADAITAGGQHIALNMPRIAQGLGYVQQYATAEAGGAGVVGGGGALVWKTAARESQAGGGARLFDIIRYGESAPGFEKHHAVLDAWASANISGYSKGRAPAVVLSREMHNITRGVFNTWRAEQGWSRQPVPWKQVSPQEIQGLTCRMLDKAGVPKGVATEYIKAFNSYIYGL